MGMCLHNPGAVSEAVARQTLQKNWFGARRALIRQVFYGLVRRPASFTFQLVVQVHSPLHVATEQAFIRKMLRRKKSMWCNDHDALQLVVRARALRRKQRLFWNTASCHRQSGPSTTTLFSLWCKDHDACMSAMYVMRVADVLCGIHVACVCLALSLCVARFVFVSARTPAGARACERWPNASVTRPSPRPHNGAV